MTRNTRGHTSESSRNRRLGRVPSRYYVSLPLFPSLSLSFSLSSIEEQRSLNLAATKRYDMSSRSHARSPVARGTSRYAITLRVELCCANGSLVQVAVPMVLRHAITRCATLNVPRATRRRRRRQRRRRHRWETRSIAILYYGCT